MAKLGPGSLKFGETGTEKEFAVLLTSAELTPEVDSADDRNYLDGSVAAGEETETWTLKGEFDQTYTAEALEFWCYTNAGQLLPFVFAPIGTGGLSAAGTAKIRAVRFGGTVKEQNGSEFEFKVQGRPNITAPAPAG